MLLNGMYVLIMQEKLHKNNTFLPQKVVLL